MAKAKSTTAKKPAAKKQAAKKPAAKKPSAKQLEAEKIASTESKLMEKYGSKIVPGSVRRAPKGSKYGKKMLVTINTVGMDGKPDGNTREVATSDVFQVSHTEEVRKQLANQRAKDKRAVKAKSKGPATVEDAATALGV